MSAPTALPPLPDQAERLVSLGLAERADLTAEEVRRAARTDAPGALLVVHPDRLAASALAPYLRHREKPGFVVTDMGDVDEFRPIPEAAVPDSALYLVTDLDRGDHLANWSPDEALPDVVAAGRTPLTLVEGQHWLLQQPDVLERNHCFMTIGSRLRKADGELDTRTPAIWISNGTGRDGAANRHAPKVGWCWAGNRHTWLGFASGARRLDPVDLPR
ncbi:MULTISPECIES: DUF5701 family protein [unclassified Nocardioides]|uniref:DUF5701 family protein n=1 Tax=unclassified Nocardioides TaxID=2615069 RepID=UPI003014239F